MGFTEKQKQVIEVHRYDKSKDLFVLVGGSGSGKTFTPISIIHRLCLEYENLRFGFFRKSYPNIKRNLIPSYNKVKEVTGTKSSSKITDFVAHYPSTGSEIVFLHIDESKDPDMDNIKGLELTGAFVDEFNQISQKAFYTLNTRIGRWNRQKKHVLSGRAIDIKPVMFATCNPNQTWVRSEFYDKFHSGVLADNVFFQESLPYDNINNLGEEYIDILKALPEVEKKRYLQGVWAYDNDPSRLITYEWYKNCVVYEERRDTDGLDSPSYSTELFCSSEPSCHSERSEESQKQEILHPKGFRMTRRKGFRMTGREGFRMTGREGSLILPEGDVFLSVDPTDEGTDRTVLTYCKGNTFFKYEEFRRQDEVKTAHLAMERMKEYNIKSGNIIIDSIGVGAGCSNTIVHKGIGVYKFVGGERPNSKLDFYRFKNKRAEAAWKLREAFQNGDIRVLHHPDLQKELLAMKYYIDNDKYISLMHKKDFIKENGYSPDYFDSLKMANYLRLVGCAGTPFVKSTRVDRVSRICRGY